MIALENFEDPRLREVGESSTTKVKTNCPAAKAYGAHVIVIHFTLAWSKLPFMLALRLRNPSAKIVLIEHTYTAAFEAHNVRHRGRFRMMLRLAYSLCDRVVAVSNGQAFWLMSVYKQDRIVSIPQSRPLRAIDASEFLEGGEAGALRFGAIGRFHRQKGFDLLIEAFRGAAIRNSTLELAGYGQEESALIGLARADPRIQFVGLIKDAERFYRQLDVVIVPSRWEAFGLVATEAMAAGCYVIAADVDGLPEQVAEHGSLFRCGDVWELRRLIEKLALSDKLPTDADKRRAAAAAAIARYEAWIGQWRILLDELCRERRETLFSEQPASAAVIQRGEAVSSTTLQLRDPVRAG